LQQNRHFRGTDNYRRQHNNYRFW